MARRLIERGMDRQTQVAIGVALGRPEQKTDFAPLVDLGERIEALAGGQPVVIGIGRVFERAAERSGRLPQIANLRHA